MVVILLTIGEIEFEHLVNRPRIDLALSGAVQGNMTQLQDWQGNGTVCLTSKVQGSDQWDGQFVGTVGGKHLEVDIALFPFEGAGNYLNGGIPDAAKLRTMPLNQVFGPSQIHIQLSRLRSGTDATHAWGTEPDPASRARSIDQLGKLAGLGKASVSLNADRRTGRVEAVLMDARQPEGPSVHLVGTFQCAPLAKPVETSPG